MVSITKTASGICGLSGCFCGYFAMLGKFLAHSLHLPMYFTIPCHSLGHQEDLAIASNVWMVP